MSDPVGFLSLKHRAKEPTTKADMLSISIREHQDHIPELFGRAAECLQLVFGIDVKGVDSINHADVPGTTWAAPTMRW